MIVYITFKILASEIYNYVQFIGSNISVGAIDNNTNIKQSELLCFEKIIQAYHQRCVGTNGELNCMYNADAANNIWSYPVRNISSLRNLISNSILLNNWPFGQELLVICLSTEMSLRPEYIR